MTHATHQRTRVTPLEQAGMFRVDIGTKDLAYVLVYTHGVAQCSDCTLAAESEVNDCPHIRAVVASDPVRFADVAQGLARERVAA